jgi:hypothetical protein
MSSTPGKPHRMVVIILTEKEWLAVVSLMQRGLTVGSMPLMPLNLVEDGEKILKKIDAKLEGE